MFASLYPGSAEWPQNQANGQNFFTPNYTILFPAGQTNNTTRVYLKRNFSFLWKMNVRQPSSNSTMTITENGIFRVHACIHYWYVMAIIHGIRGSQFQKKVLLQKKLQNEEEEKCPHKPLTKQQTRSLPYFLPESSYIYISVVFAASYCRYEYILGHSLTELTGLCSLVDNFRQGGVG